MEVLFPEYFQSISRIFPYHGQHLRHPEVGARVRIGRHVFLYFSIFSHVFSYLVTIVIALPSFSWANSGLLVLTSTGTGNLQNYGNWIFQPFSTIFLKYFHTMEGSIFPVTASIVETIKRVLWHLTGSQTIRSCSSFSEDLDQRHLPR